MNYRLPLLFLPLLLVACAPLPAPASTHTPAPTAVPATLTPFPPSATPPPTNAPSTDPVACLNPVAHAAFTAPEYARYPQALLDYLNLGATPADLSEAIAAANFGAQPVALVVADFTGDRLLDIAVSLINPESATLDGRLALYTCQLGRYGLAYERATDDAHALGFHLWYWQDLNADGAAELVASQGQCGASACFDAVEILAWQGAGFANVLLGASDDLPYPSLEILDPDGDGIFAIQLTGAGFGSVGAGPQRAIIRSWDFDQVHGGWVSPGDILGPSSYRIHVIHDADTQLAAGNFEQALLLYRRAIDDPTLEDWADPEGERLTLSAYALYRIFVIHTLAGDDTLAQAAQDEMQQTFPVPTVQYDYVDMALLFKNAYASGSAQSGCNAVIGFAEAHAATILEPLGSLTYGYANRDYTAAEMCVPPEGLE